MSSWLEIRPENEFPGLLMDECLQRFFLHVQWRQLILSGI
jgi:hypothetical protein